MCILDELTGRVSTPTVFSYGQVQIMRLVKVYCGTCGTVFGGRLALKSHYRNSPGCSQDDPFTEDIKYHCRLCNEQFDMKVLRPLVPRACATF